MRMLFALMASFLSVSSLAGEKSKVILDCKKKYGVVVQLESSGRGSNVKYLLVARFDDEVEVEPLTRYPTFLGAMQAVYYSNSYNLMIFSGSKNGRFSVKLRSPFGTYENLSCTYTGPVHKRPE